MKKLKLIACLILAVIFANNLVAKMVDVDYIANYKVVTVTGGLKNGGSNKCGLESYYSVTNTELGNPNSEPSVPDVIKKPIEPNSTLEVVKTFLTGRPGYDEPRILDVSAKLTITEDGKQPQDILIIGCERISYDDRYLIPCINYSPEMCNLTLKFIKGVSIL